MIKALLAIRLRSAFFSMMGGKRGADKKAPSVAKIVGFTLLYAYVIAVFLGLSVMMSVMFGAALIPMGASWLYFAIFATATFTVLFFMSIFETKSELFDCKDNELLLSMPIRSRDIVAARIFAVLVYNYATALVVMAPAVIVYLVISSDIVGTLGSVLSLLILPLPATALASAVGYIVAIISKRTRHSTLITSLVSIGFLLLYFWFYFSLMGNSDAFFENMDSALAGAVEKLAFLRIIGSAIMLSPLEFIIFLVLSLGISLLAYILISKNYVKIVTDNRGAKRTVYKMEKLKKNGVILSLAEKELRRLTSSSAYMLNAGMGVIFRLAVGVMALIKGHEVRALIGELTAELPFLNGVVCVGVSAVMIVLSSLDMISASSVSMEGKNLWIIKSMPIRATNVLIAKTAAHCIVCVPVTLVSTVMILIGVGAPAADVPLAVITPLVCTVMFAVFGTVINVACPKFEFDNEAQPVKQSLAVFIVMFAQMLFAGMVIIASVVLTMFLGGIITTALILLLNLFLLAILAVIMIKISAPRFANL